MTFAQPSVDFAAVHIWIQATKDVKDIKDLIDKMIDLETSWLIDMKVIYFVTFMLD